MTLSDIIGLKVTLNCKSHLFLAIFYQICCTCIDTFSFIDSLYLSLCALYFAICLVFISKPNYKIMVITINPILVVLLITIRLPVLSNYFFHVV